ncbi:MAG: PASTA domain-containing protein [Syntrophomonadaceae bacterium]|nr:PASTA domain-containing protein [Syntrophomonadaceae bacterium]
MDRDQPDLLIPDIVAWEIEDAIQLLTKSGFKVQQIKVNPDKTNSNEFDNWRVLRQKRLSDEVFQLVVAPFKTLKP